MKPAIFVAFFWALLPLLPAILNNSIAGSPFTDLYPSVWSIWATGDWVTNGFHLSLLNHPDGMSWYPNSLLHGIIAQPLLLILPLHHVYNLLLLCSRFLSALAFYFAGKTIGSSHQSGMLMMIIVGCSPFLHGFSVEGILEGSNAWGLGFWLWAIFSKRYKTAIVFFALSLISNWYYGAAVCLLAFLLGFINRKAWLSFVGLLPCFPFIWMFLSGTTGDITLAPEIRQQMGFQWGIPTPNLLAQSNPFAMTTYLGWIVIPLALFSRNIYCWLAIIPFTLSQGWPTLYELPILEALRFPYRWHIATMILLGLAVLRNPMSHRFRWLPYAILLETTLLSPIDIMLPSAPATFPNYLKHIDGPVLDVPGPLVRAPGEIDHSRPRNKIILYYQGKHRQPNGWALPFNGLQSGNDCFAETRIVDPHATNKEKSESGPLDCWKPIQWVVIHNNNKKLDPFLLEQGFELQNEQPPRLWKRSQ